MHQEMTTFMRKDKKSASYVPGFWDGLASIFGASQPVEGESISDKDALLSDWENVGKDIKSAMGKFVLR